MHQTVPLIDYCKAFTIENKKAAYFSVSGFAKYSAILYHYGR